MLKLRNYEASDASRLVELANNLNVSRYLVYTFPFPYTRDDADWWIKTGAHLQGAQTRVIEHDSVFVGSVAITPQVGWRSHIAEIGYWLGEEFWGRGLAGEALRQMTELSFSQYDYQKLFASVLGPNQASMKVLERNGYELEAVLKKEIVKNGQTYDHHIFAKHRR